MIVFQTHISETQDYCGDSFPFAIIQHFIFPLVPTLNKNINNNIIQKEFYKGSFFYQTFDCFLEV